MNGKFLYNLGVVLGHSIIFYTKESYRSVDMQCCGGVDEPPGTTESMDQVLQAYAQNLPKMATAIREQILPQEQAQLAASQAVSPGYTALQSDLYKQFAPGLAQTASDIERQTQLARSSGDVQVMAGPGQQLIDLAIASSRKADPEFYRTRELEAEKFNQLMSNMDPSGLSGGERAEVSRGLAQGNSTSGNLGVPSNIKTVENVMTFGNALQAKQQALANVLNNVTGFLPASQSRFDPTAVALGRPSFAANLADTKFQGNTQTGANAMNLGSQVFGAAAAQQQQNQQLKAQAQISNDPFAKFQQVLSFI